MTASIRFMVLRLVVLVLPTDSLVTLLGAALGREKMISSFGSAWTSQKRHSACGNVLPGGGLEVVVVVDVFFFQLAAEFSGQFGPDEAIDQVGGEAYGEEPRQDVAPGDEEEADDDDSDDHFWEAASGAPVEAFEGGVADVTDHHDGEEDEYDGEGVAEPAILEGFGLVVVPPQEEEGDGGDEAGGGGDGEADEVRGFFGAGHFGDAIEAGEAEGAADEVDGGDEPAEFGS